MNSVWSTNGFFWAAVCVLGLSVAVLTGLLVDVLVKAGQRYQNRFNENAQRHAQAFFWLVEPQRLWAMHLAALGVVGSLVWLFTGGWWWVVGVCLVLLWAPQGAYRWLRWHRHQVFEGQLPDALLSLAGGLRAGASLSVALQAVVQQSPAPLGQELGLLLREQRLGLHLDACLANLQRRVPTHNTLLVVSALRIASQTGGNLAETLERTAQTLRQKLLLEGKIQALTAQGKLQAWVVGLLPLFLMAVLNHMEPQAMSHLWHSPLGWATLAVVATLEVLGIYSIRRIVSIDV